jgi:hypothetical protein
MGAICVLAPVIVTAWPAFGSAVVAAAASLGYTAVEDTVRRLTQTTQGNHSVELEIANSELVSGQLGRDQRIAVMRDGVTVTFSRDARGAAKLCVSGKGHSAAALQAMGEELSRRVVQKYVYQRLLDEMRARDFFVVEEETDTNNAIHLRVRHWEN